MIDRDRLAVGSKRHRPDFDLDTPGAGLGLAETDRCYSRFAVGTSGNREQIEAGCAHACHYFDGSDALGRRLVCEQRRTRDVTDSIDAGAGGAERVVNFDEAAALELRCRPFPDPCSRLNGLRPTATRTASASIVFGLAFGLERDGLHAVALARHRLVSRDRASG